MEFVTLRTLTNDLLRIVRASNISASETISIRQIEDWVHQYRGVLLKRDLDKGKKPNPDYIQEINQLRVTPVELVGDNVLENRNTTNTVIFRTTLELPKTIDLNFTSGFTYIGTSTGNRIQLIPESRSEWQEYKKYTPIDPLCFLRNGHLFIINSDALEFITVRGIFEVPSEVGRFVNPITEQPYFNLDSKYPIPITLVPALKEMILQKELKIEVTSPTDNTNDAVNNPGK
jgi:hypothetical protein